jgi:hypothetical protein
MRWREALVLTAILGLAAGLRLWRLDAPSLWLDELLSLEATVCRPPLAAGVPTGILLEPPPSLTRLEGACAWPRVWGGLVHYAHPPLYFVLLRTWRELFGEGDFAARSLSVVAGVVAVLALFLALQAAAGTRRALWGAALLAVAAPQVLYSQEARGYTLLVALALGAATAVLRIERLGLSGPRLVALFACSAAALLVHYYAVGPLVALAAFAGIRLEGSRRRGVLLALVAAALVFGALWGPQALPRQDRMLPQWLSASAFAPDLSRIAQRVAALPLAQLRNPTPQLEPDAPVWPAVAYLLPVLALRRRPQLLLFWLWLVSCVGLVTAVDLVLGRDQLSILRYTLTAGPAVCALLALVVSDQRASVRDLAPLAGALVAASALPWVTHADKPPWRDVARVVSVAVRDGEPLLHTQPQQLLAVDHYAPADARPIVLLAGRLPEATRRRLADASAVWLLVKGSDSEGVPASLVPGAELVEAVSVAEAATLMRLRMPPE